SPRILSNIARYHGALMPLFAFAILCVAAIAFLVISHFLDGQELIRLQKGAYSGQEKQVLDKLTAGYGRVNDFLQANQYERALEGLASLRNLLDDPSAASLPAIQRRRGVELFLIGSPEELVKDRQARTEKSRDTRSIEEAASRLRQASVFYQAGNFEAAIDRYEQSLGLLLRDKALARQFTDSLTKAGYRVLAEDELTELSRLRTIAHQRQDLSARLRDIRAQYKAYAALVPKSSAEDPSSPESLATLLQTKILLRQVLDAEPVISQYPDLAAKTERYFDAVTAKARDDGRKEALDVLDSLLGKLQSGD